MSFFKNKLGILLALIYLIASMVILGDSTEGSWGGFLLFVSAFPFSILSLFVSNYVNGPLANGVFIFLNAIWWFLLGWLITKIFRKKRPLQNSFSPDSRNLNKDFRLFLFQISTDFTQIPP